MHFFVKTGILIFSFHALSPTLQFLLFLLPLVFFQRRQWQPTPVFLPGDSQERELGGAWWARTESDATEAAQQQQLPFFSPSPFPQKGHNPHFLPFSSLCSSVRLLSCVLALCDPMDCSLPGFPVHHQLLEFAQTHVLRVSDAIQPSHPHSSPSPAFSLCQHQGLFQ